MTLILLTGCGRDITPEQRQADSTYTLATSAFEQGDFQRARVFLREAVVLDQNLGRDAQLADEHRLLARVFAGVAEFDSAVEHYDRAIIHAKAVADRGGARSSTLEIAALYRFIGEERKAFSLYIEALRLARVFGDEAGVLDIEWAMLPSARALRNFEEEDRILSNLLNHAVTTGNVQTQARVYSETGYSYRRAGDEQGALENFLRALTFADQLRDTLASLNVLKDIGDLYEHLGKPNDALQTYGEALNRADRTAANADGIRLELLIRVGNVYLARQQLNDAVRFYRAGLNAAIRRKNKIAEGYLFLQLGHCYLGGQGNLPEALKSFQSGLELFDGLAYPAGQVYAHVSLGMGRQRAGQLTEALVHYKKSVETREVSYWLRPGDDVYLECEDASGQSSEFAPYDVLIELLLELGRYEEAFWYMERRHGFQLFHSLSSLDAKTPQESLNESLAAFQHQRALRVGAERTYRNLLEENISVVDRITDVKSSMEGYGTRLAENAEKIVQTTRVLEPFVRIANIGLAEVLKLLPKGVVLVEHFPARKALYMFVASNARVSVEIAAVKKETVVSQVDEFNALLNRRQQAADSSDIVKRALERRIDELTTSLYSSFVRPIEGDIAGATKLLVVPQKETAKLPLHALRRVAVRGQSYVAQQFVVSYLPAALTLLYKPAPSRANQSSNPLPQGPSSLEVAGVGYAGTTEWDAEYELRDTRAFFKDARLYFGQDATLATVRNERADVFQLAAEFSYDEMYPGNSYFILSDGKAFNTWRKVFWGELTKVHSFPLVILSDFSGSGATMESELPFILFSQGCASVITQSYSPARRTTKYFGEFFYTSLAAGLSVQDAFKEMQNGMIKDPENAASYVWAQYFLWGK
ncbi:MAG TPA: tetratricopeptide repeat protein [Bacteroidota bacterium]